MNEFKEDVSVNIRVRAVLAFKWMIDLARHPKIAGALQDCIGQNVLLFLSGVWSKRPGTDTFVSWHQDGAYNSFDRKTGTTAWIGLTDSTPEKGIFAVFLVAIGKLSRMKNVSIRIIFYQEGRVCRKLTLAKL